MRESKIEATERLRREGRWEDASRYREEVRNELRSEGRPRAEAAGAAWDAMLEKYPPLPAAELVSQGPAAELENIDIDALVARFKGNEPDLARDILWAYENLENRKARPEDGPSLGAWALLKWARDYRNRFFEQLLPKAIAAREKCGREKRSRPGYAAYLEPGQTPTPPDDLLRELSEGMGADATAKLTPGVVE